MAAPPIVSGQDDGFAARIKLTDQIAHQPGAHERMIDRAENDSIGFDALEAPYPLADRRQLALLPILVQNDHRDFQVRDRTDLLGARAKHDAGHSDARIACYLNQVFEESAFAVGKQRFRSAHPAGSAGGENDGGEQTGPLTPPKRV